MDYVFVRAQATRCGAHSHIIIAIFRWWWCSGFRETERDCNCSMCTVYFQLVLARSDMRVFSLLFGWPFEMPAVQFRIRVINRPHILNVKFIVQNVINFKYVHLEEKTGLQALLNLNGSNLFRGVIFNLACATCKYANVQRP